MGTRGEPEAYPWRGSEGCAALRLALCFPGRAGLCQPLGQLFLKLEVNSGAPPLAHFPASGLEGQKGATSQTPRKAQNAPPLVKNVPGPYAKLLQRLLPAPLRFLVRSATGLPSGLSGAQRRLRWGAACGGRGAPGRCPSRRPRGARRVTAIVRPPTPARRQVAGSGGGSGNGSGAQVSAVVITTGRSPSLSGAALFVFPSVCQQL